MFSFFKSKGPAGSATVVNAAVGAPLVRKTNFPAIQAVPESTTAARQLALKGIPPRASFVDTPIAGQTTMAFVVEGAAGQPPLALVNISGTGAHIELWELGSTEKHNFVRRREVRLDPAQNSWAAFLLSGVARLPGNRLLLAVFYYAPQVKEALFLYDIAADSYTKLANVVPFDTLDQQKFFEARQVAPGTVIVQYYSANIRLAPEVYYNTPSHLRLYSLHHPQGMEILRFGADDGGIEQWTVVDSTLWVHTKDPRDGDNPQEFTWSLNLQGVL